MREVEERVEAYRVTGLCDCGGEVVTQSVEYVSALRQVVFNVCDRCGATFKGGQQLPRIEHRETQPESY